MTELGWLNGNGTMTDSFDIGIYSTALVRLVSGGGTARSGVSSWQWVDVTDTPLSAGRYYLAMSNNGTTAAQFRCWVVTAATLALLGCQDSATDAYVLPNPLTNMAATATMVNIPVVAVAMTPHFA